MSEPRFELASMLARQVLGFQERDRIAPHPGTSDPRLTDAQIQIDLRLESMVRGICQKVWVDNAAIAETVEAKIRAALDEASIEAEIDRTVCAELKRLRQEITRRIEHKISEQIELGIQDALGTSTRRLANKITSRMWDKSFGEVAPRRGFDYKAPAHKPRKRPRRK